MTLIGYQYIQHTINQREWGVECQFTVTRDIDNTKIDDLISIPSAQSTLSDIGALIQARLDVAHALPNVPEVTEIICEDGSVIYA